MAWTMAAGIAMVVYAAWNAFFSVFCFADLSILLLCIFILYFFVRLFDEAQSKLKQKTTLALILLLAAFVRIGWVAFVDNKLVSDFAVYEELSRALVSGDGYALTGPVGADDVHLYLGGSHKLPYTTAYRAPGTALWGAFLYGIFGPHWMVFKLSNVLLGTGSVLLLYLLFSSEPWLARRSALLWAVYPSSFMATNLFGSEVLHSFLLLSLALLLTQKGTIYKFIPAGVVLGCAALVRSMLLPLSAASASSILLSLGWKKGVRAVLVILAVTLLTLSPWMARNWLVFHRLIPVSTSQGDFLGRHTTNVVPTFLQDGSWRARQASWRGMTNEEERSREGYAIALDNWKRMMQGGPSHVKECLWRGTLALFGDDLDILFWSTRRSYYSVKNEGADEALDSRAMTFWLWVTIGFYLFVLSWSLVGAVRAARKKANPFFERPFLPLYFLIFFFTHILVAGQTRYHFSVMPLFIALAAYGIPKNGPAR